MSCHRSRSREDEVESAATPMTGALARVTANGHMVLLLLLVPALRPLLCIRLRHQSRLGKPMRTGPRPPSVRFCQQWCSDLRSHAWARVLPLTRAVSTLPCSDGRLPLRVSSPSFTRVSCSMLSCSSASECDFTLSNMHRVASFPALADDCQ